MKKISTATLQDRIRELERRQLRKWSRDREWQLNRLKKQEAGVFDNVTVIARMKQKECGKIAVNTSSRTENDFALRARQAGWTISKRGWPDFFMWKDGKLACVEVKGDIAPLRLNQKAVLEGLAAYGVPCYTWRPLEGFRRIRGDEARNAISAAM